MIHIDSSDYKRSICIQNGEKNNFNIGFIGINSYINSLDLNITSGDEVVNLQIGNYCSLAYNIIALINRNHDYKAISTSSIFNSDIKKIKQKGEILIGNDVWVGNNVILLSGIKVGNGAVIGAGAVVSKDVPPYAIVAGNPMRIIKYRFNGEQIQKLLQIKWWNWDLSRIEINKKWFSRDIDKFIEKFYQEPMQLASISMQKKKEAILFIPDFNDPYSIWKKVITEYLSKYTKEDDITLILRINQDEDFQNNINRISQLLEKKSGICKDNMPDILVINDNIEEQESLFKGMDYFITTRSADTIKHMEWCNEFGVKMLSGVDIPIFECTSTQGV